MTAFSWLSSSFISDFHDHTSCLPGHNLPGPIRNPAKFVDVRIPHVEQLLCSLLAAVPAAAVDQDDLVQIRKLFRLFRANALVGNQNRAGNFRPTPKIIVPFGAQRLNRETGEPYYDGVTFSMTERS